MDSFGTGSTARGYDVIAHQVRLVGWCRTYVHGLVGIAYMQGVTVGIAVNSYGFYTHFARRTHYPQSNFAAIGNQ
jgi:hypothetical protein